ncbi:hypothetical protein [Acinetobacter baumannii]|uniref:hypothetical protein n=1 Tax=Acinetobacter baumannii TaxID=470 RepID=UPI001D192F38|nr:hypothetical protein [Acinetobacter baumannii]
MIVDFFRHGSGLSKGCLDYLLGEDREREHAQVLNGDVELTAQLIDSSPFAKNIPVVVCPFMSMIYLTRINRKSCKILRNVYSRD